MRRDRVDIEALTSSRCGRTLLEVVAGLALLFLAGCPQPISGDVNGLEIAVVLGIIGTLLVVPNRSNAVGRARGVVLLALYGVFVVAVLSA